MWSLMEGEIHGNGRFVKIVGKYALGIIFFSFFLMFL